jgi:predicted PurR-regulated permease PerM
VNLGQYIGLLALILALYILWQIRQILLLFFTAVVLATSLNQLVKQFQRSGLRRTWAVFLSINIFLVIFIIFLGLIVPAFATQFQELFRLLARGLQAIQNAVNWLEERFLGTDFPGLDGLDNIIQQIQPLATQVVGQSVVLLQLLLSSSSYWC